MVELHAYQKQAVLFALHAFRTHGGAGLFLDMGLGKTLTTIAILDVMHRLHPDWRFLIVAPKTVAVNTWPAELAKWRQAHTLDWAVACGVKSNAKQRREALAQQATVTIINQENLGWLDRELAQWPWDGIVLDELSGYKDPSSNRFRILKRRRQDRTHAPKHPGHGRPVQWVLGLTGTPAAKGWMDLWAQCRLLDTTGALETTLTRYRETYFTPGRRNGHVVYEWRARPGAFDRIMRRIEPFCLTMLAREQLQGLPDKPLIIDHWVEMPEQTRREYERFKHERWLELAGRQVTAVNAGVLAGKLVQFTSGCLYPDEDSVDGRVIHYDAAKLDVFDRIMAESQGEQILVFYQLRDELERLRAKYGKRVRTVDEPGIVDAWNRGEVPVLAAHPAQAKFGLNLQHAGHIIVWLNLTWSLEDWAQANARLDRQGQTRIVQIHRIVTRDSVDERKLDVLSGRAVLADAVMGELKHTTVSAD